MAVPQMTISKSSSSVQHTMALASAFFASPLFRPTCTRLSNSVFCSQSSVKKCAQFAEIHGPRRPSSTEFVLQDRDTWLPNC